MDPQPPPSNITKGTKPCDDLSLRASQSEPPTFGPNAKFTHFKLLPFELRIDIWRRGATFSPPTMHLRTGGTHEIPAVLHACSESREEFLAKEGVTKSHPTYFSIPLPVCDTPRTMLFCPEQDAMEALETSQPGDLFKSGDFDFLLSKIRYFLVDRLQDWSYALGQMVNLRKVLLRSQVDPNINPHAFPRGSEAFAEGVATLIRSRIDTLFSH